MRICGRFGVIPIIIIICLFGTAGSPLSSLAQDKESVQQAKAAIQRLHEQDVRATLTGKADDLAKLWDSEAVRIQPGLPAEIGKTTIYADDKREEESGHGQSACYKPEFKDLQINGDWAFEWGYFSYKESANAKPGRGKALRVIKRQPDGSWKFARVIGFTEPVEAAAPMSNPCQ